MKNAVAMIALFVLTGANTPPPAHCVPKAAMADMVVVLIPPFVDALAKQCAGHVPPSAFLNRGATEFTARLRGEMAGHEAGAAEALRQFADNKIPPVQDQKALVQVMSEMMATEFTHKIEPKQCGAASEFFEAMAPLPASNIGRLLTSFFRLAGVGKDGHAPAICPDD